MKKDVKISNIIWDYLLQIKYDLKKEDIKDIYWINEYEFIVIINDNKYIYNTNIRKYRHITYNKYTVTEDDLKNEFCNKLNFMMYLRNISQKELAFRLKTTQPLVSQYCTGKVMPTQFMIHKMCLIFDCDDSYFTYKDY